MKYEKNKLTTMKDLQLEGQIKDKLQWKIQKIYR